MLLAIVRNTAAVLLAALIVASILSVRAEAAAAGAAMPRMAR